MVSIVQYQERGISRVDINIHIFSLRKIKYCSILEHQIEKESTQEYFYQDVTSVSTTTTTKDVTNKLEDNKKEEIEEEAFVFIILGDKQSFAYIGNDSTNESVKGMKNLLREKNGQKIVIRSV